MKESVIVKIDNNSRIGSEWLSMQYCYHPLSNKYEIQIVFYAYKQFFIDKTEKFGLQKKQRNIMTFILDSKEDFERTYKLLNKMYLGKRDDK